MPYLASVIHSNNKAILQNTAHQGLLSINLEALMLTGPLSVDIFYNPYHTNVDQVDRSLFQNPVAHSQWLLEYRCNIHRLYNSTMCTEMFSNLPTCLESIELAYQFSDVYHRSRALQTCYKYLNTPPDNDILLQDIRRSVLHSSYTVCIRIADPVCHIV